MDKITCLKCGYTWTPRKKNPKCCSRCKAKEWGVAFNQKCKICKRLVFSPCVHHINGNRQDNRKSNRIIVCSDCHHAIHQGIGTTNGRVSKRRHYYNTKNRKSQKYSKIDDKILQKNFLIVKKLQYYQNKLKENLIKKY